MEQKKIYKKKKRFRRLWGSKRGNDRVNKGNISKTETSGQREKV